MRAAVSAPCGARAAAPARPGGRRRGLSGLLALAVLVPGCAAHRPAREAPAPRPLPGYEQRVDAFSAVDTTRLHGRRIAIDPGHGGRFRGSIGVNGLSEADVNLGVALYLRGLLEARGATVMMTRTDDSDFLTPADSSLKADLAERTRRVNAFAPDLFISIHHNADAGGAHDVNGTQTYYKLGDEGPSLDAAESVHRFLVRNLGIRSHQILPGNYYVLRSTNAPALLTESSYLTNPDVEAKLALASKQRLEAEAIYLGIAHFFARGAPVIESFAAVTAPGAAPDTAFADVRAPTFEARVRGAFDEARLEVDDAPVPLVRAGARLTARPRGVLGNGVHEAVLRVRRAGDGAARPARLAFTIARPLDHVTAEAWPRSVPASGVVGVRLALHDRFGAVVPDSTVMRISRGDGRHDTTAVFADGVAWLYPRGLRPGRVVLELHPADGTAGAWSTATTIEAAPARDTVWAGFLRVRRPDGTAPLTGAPGTREPERRVPWLDRDGFAVLERDASGGPVVPRLAGYRRLAGDDGALAPAFVAIAGGALHGHRIVLDPDGGGGDPAGVGPSGTRAAHVNLRIARILRGYLEAAGANVKLTRDGDFALSDVERVQISEAFHAERYLRIGHRAEPPRLGYFYSSAAGRAWAGHTAAWLERLGFGLPPAGDDAQYPLQQTSCPALYVSAARIDRAPNEDALFAPGALRSEAYALYLAFVSEWSQDSAFRVDSLFVRDSTGDPVAGAAVTLGDALMFETDAAGRIRFARTEPGPVDAVVVDSRLHAEATLLDSTSGAILTGPRGRR